MLLNLSISEKEVVGRIWPSRYAPGLIPISIHVGLLVLLLFFVVMITKIW